MSHSFVNGASSLFLIISAIHAIRKSKLLLWKITNVILIVASYLCNSSNYNPYYLFFDYLMITLVCMSYINHYKTNFLLTSLLLLEYFNTKSIATVKVISYISSTGLAIYKTYIYVDKYHFNLLLVSSLTGFTIYIIRYSFIEKNNTYSNFLLTTAMHICATNILYVSSITAK